MPVAAADLIAFASLNMPADDTSTSGGGIDLDRRVVFTDLAANDDVEAVSSAAGDTTQTVTIVARKADGSSVTEAKLLTGTTAVIFAVNGIVERIQSVSMDLDAVGTVTIRRSVAGPTIGTIPPGERGFMRLFRNAASEVGATERYEKFFWKNTHATLALLSALVKQNADPTAKITHALAAAKDDAVSVANRKTSPGLTFNDTDKAVPGTDLGAGVAIGVWLNLSLIANDSPIKNTYTSEISGNSA